MAKLRHYQNKLSSQPTKATLSLFVSSNISSCVYSGKITFNGLICIHWAGYDKQKFLHPISAQRGRTVRNGSGSMFAVAYTASAVAQNTSSCLPVGWW